MIEYIVLLFGIVVLLLYYYLTANFNFWRKRGIPGPKPIIFFGTMKEMLLHKTILGKYLIKLFEAYEGASLIGFFEGRTPVLIVKDVNLIKDVLIKDAACFSTRGVYVNVKAEPLNYFIFFENGPIAHFVRTKFSPLLTPSKLKETFYFLLKSLERLEKYLDELLLENDRVDFMDLASRLVGDMAASSLLGIDLKTLTKTDEECHFISNINVIRGSYWNTCVREIFMRFPTFYKIFAPEVKKATEFYVNFTHDLIRYREEHNIVKSDFLGLLMELRKNPGKLTEILGKEPEDVFFVGQLFGFFLGSYETTTVTLSNMLCEIANNPDIQDKLRKEIQNTIAENNGELQFEDLNKMPYLNAFSKEILRKYSPADVLRREATEEYTFKHIGVTIPKHQKIVIPVYATHFNPKVYPKPYVFDPERFLGEPVESGNYLPFGHGSRNCMGERLGIIQSKLGIIGILRKYKVEVCQEADNETQIFNPLAYVKFLRNEKYLKITKIN